MGNVSKDESNLRKLAAIMQRQQRRLTNQVSFLTQQRHYPSHGRYLPLQSSIGLQHSLPVIDWTRSTIPIVLNDDCSVSARRTIDSQGNAFNSIRRSDSILASQLQPNDTKRSYTIGGSTASNFGPVELVRQHEKQNEDSNGPSFLSTNNQLLLGSLLDTDNEIFRSLRSQACQTQTMRSSATLDRLAPGALHTLERVPLPIDIYSNNIPSTGSYFTRATSCKDVGRDLRFRAGSLLLPVASSQPQAYNLPNVTESRNGGINGTVSQTIPMQSDTDVHHLSKYQCLIRQQLDFFAAKPENAVFSVQGRKKPIRIGQVGIQCRHCCHLPHRRRGRGAVYYPVNLAGVYQAVQNMATVHLNQHCSEILDGIRNELKSLRGKRDESTSTGGKYYWTTKCEDAGIVEQVDGIFFSST